MTAAEIVPASAEYARSLTDKIKVAVEGTWHLITEAYQSRAWSALGYSSWDDYCTREFGTSRLRLPREERAETVQSLRDSGLSLRAIAAVTGDSKDTVARVLAPVSFETPQVSGSGHLDSDESGFLPKPIVDHTTGEVLPEGPQDAVGGDAPLTQAECEALDGQGVQDPHTLAAPGTPGPITGIDGKNYPRPASIPKPERRSDLTASARRLSVDLYRLTNRIQKLGQDDRLGRNEEQVAALLRNHLSDAVEVCQDLLDRLPTRTGV